MMHAKWAPIAAALAIACLAVGGCVTKGSYNKATQQANDARLATEKAKADLASAQAELVETKAALAKAQGEVGRTSQALADLSSQLAQARADLDAAEKNREIDARKFKAQWDKAEAEVDRLTQKVRELTKAQQAALDAVRAKDHTIVKQNRQVAELQAKLKEALQGVSRQ